MNITSSKPITLSEAKNILEKRKKEAELEYEQQQAFEHTEQFAHLEPKAAKKLVDELMKNEKVNIDTAIKIVDIMPKKPETLKAILLKDKIEMTDEEITQLLELLKK